MRIVFLGAPGVGKGTIARKVAELTPLEHLSIGSLLRKQVDRKTKLGLAAKKIMAKGALLPDKLVLPMVKRVLKKKSAVILDGFPRDVEQAVMFDEFEEVDLVIYLKAPKRVLVSRIMKRINEEKHHKLSKYRNMRADDKPSLIKKRLDVYNKQTKPLIKYYKKQKKLVTINANKEVKPIVMDVLTALSKIEI